MAIRQRIKRRVKKTLKAIIDRLVDADNEPFQPSEAASRAPEPSEERVGSSETEHSEIVESQAKEEVEYWNVLLHRTRPRLF